MGFQGEKDLFSHASFHFPTRGFFTILGPSGCGKSTFLHLLSGLLSPKEGRVLYRGKPLSRFKEKEKTAFHAKETAFLFQHYELIEPCSALDNVSLPLRLAGEKKKKAEEKALSLLQEFGLEEKARQKAGTLSGGEKQRVALCRALASSPSIVFADEPTGALDSLSATKVMEALSKESKTRLIIMVSHNEGLAERYSDALIRFEKGEILFPAILADGILTERKERMNRPSPSWRIPFLFRHLEEGRWKASLSFLSGFIGIGACLLSASFALGSPVALEAAERESLGFAFAELRKRETVEVQDSPVHLVKESRPSEDEASAFIKGEVGISLERDLRYFFPERNVVSFRGTTQESVRFAPVLDPSLSWLGPSLLLEGSTFEASSFSSCFANESFFEERGLSVGDVIQVPISFSFPYQAKEDLVQETVSFRLEGKVKDFAFFGEPTLYYSYRGLENYLRNVPLPHIQETYGNVLSIPLLLSEQESASFLGESSWLFAEGKDAAERLWEMMEDLSRNGEGFVLSSPTYLSGKSFSMLAEGFDAALVLFSLLIALTLSFVLAISSASSFAEHKKECAILRVLGASEKDVSSLFLDEGMLTTFLSAIAALSSFPFLSRSLNTLFQARFGIPSLLSLPFPSFLGIPYFLPLLFLAAPLILAFVSVRIPLSYARKAPFVEELRDE